MDTTLNKDENLRGKPVVGLDSKPQPAKSFISKEYKGLVSYHEDDLQDKTAKK